MASARERICWLVSFMVIAMFDLELRKARPHPCPLPHGEGETISAMVLGWPSRALMASARERICWLVNFIVVGTRLRAPPPPRLWRPCALRRGKLDLLVGEFHGDEVVIYADKSFAVNEAA
jgi:hypothetical protein